MHGGYGHWSGYGACSRSCGGGVSTRSRRCNNPAPAHGGTSCLRLGAASSSVRCSTHACPSKDMYLHFWNDTILYVHMCKFASVNKALSTYGIAGYTRIKKLDNWLENHAYHYGGNLEKNKPYF